MRLTDHPTLHRVLMRTSKSSCLACQKKKLLSALDPRAMTGEGSSLGGILITVLTTGDHPPPDRGGGGEVPTEEVRQTVVDAMAHHHVAAKTHEAEGIPRLVEEMTDLRILITMMSLSTS